MTSLITNILFAELVGLMIIPEGIVLVQAPKYVAILRVIGRRLL